MLESEFGDYFVYFFKPKGKSEKEKDSSFESKRIRDKLDKINLKLEKIDED